MRRNLRKERLLEKFQRHTKVVYPITGETGVVEQAVFARGALSLMVRFGDHCTSFIEKPDGRLLAHGVHRASHRGEGLRPLETPN